MSKLEILHFPDERLRNVAKTVTEITADTHVLIDNMFETMYDAPGIGLAATQINIAQRIVVIDISEEKDSPLCLINPEILELRGEEQMEEGCLSVPGIYETVERADWVRYQALDRDGQKITGETDGLLAICIQHEIDHLDGKLFVDYLSELKRQRIKKKAIKAQKEEASSANNN